jgi:hypothetical protein
MTMDRSSASRLRTLGAIAAVAIILPALGLAGPRALAVPGERFKADLLHVPLSFEPNRGQAASSVQFLSRGSGYALFLDSGGVVLNLQQQQPASGAASADTLRMSLIGANAKANAVGLAPQPGVVSYLIGNDPKNWRSGIPTYGKVDYAQIYPGVDLVFYGNQRQLEYDFVVAPGADPSRIAWRIDGARASVDSEGNLVLDAPNGPASFKKPVLYQMDGDKKTGVEGEFAVAGNRVRFRLGSYDRSRALVIDPVLSYASYLAGTSTDRIGLPLGPGNLAVGVSQGIAVDSLGSAYVTGYTYSVDFPTKNPYASAPPAKGPTGSPVPPGAWPTAFVTKFSPDGSSLVYSTYLGGDDYDQAYAIAVDSSGNAYVTGETDSANFPVTAGAYQTVCDPNPSNAEPLVATCYSSNASAFVTKLNPTGTGIVYSTFLGGYAYDYATAIAVDSAGRAYIAGNEDESCSTGYTYQGCFPTTSGAVIGGNRTGGGSPQYAFVAAFDPTGAQLLYSTIFGDLNGIPPGGPITTDAGTTWGTGVAVDANDNFYLVGETTAGQLPTTAGVIQPSGAPLGSTGTYLQVYRGFVAKFTPVTSPGGASLAYATYLGGRAAGGGDYVSGIAIDSSSNAYIAGYTNSTDFPVTAGAYSTVCGPNGQTCSAAHVTKLNPTATSILWSTFVGDAKPDGSDAVYSTGPVQLDGNGNVYIMGQPGVGFPMVNPVEPTPTGGDQQVLIAELDPTGANLLFSTTIGSKGLDSTVPAGLAVDPGGTIYLAGNDSGPNLITTPGAFQTTAGASGCCYHGFVAKIGPFAILTIATSSPLPAATVGVAYSHNLNAAAGSQPYTWSVTGGALPAGLTLASTGTVSGTPTAAGSFNFTVQVKDSTGATASTPLALTVSISSAPVIATLSPLLSGYVNGAYSQTLVATGGTPPYAWSVTSGALPGGLTLGSGGAITGQPSAAGVSDFKVQVLDSKSAAATGTFALTVLAVTGSLARVGVLPQFAAGGSVATTIWVVNTSPSTAVPVSLVFHADNGTQAFPATTPLTVTQQGVTQVLTTTTLDTVLNPNTTLVVNAGQNQTANVQGWVDVLANASVSGFAIFTYAPDGLAPTGAGYFTPWEATVPLQSQLSASTMTLPFIDSGGFITGIAIGSLTGSAANITATFFDLNGNPLPGSSPQNISLPANGHTAFLFSAPPDGENWSFTSGQQGVVQFTGSGLMGLGLRVSPYSTETALPTILQ